MDQKKKGNTTSHIHYGAITAKEVADAQPRSTTVPKTKKPTLEAVDEPVSASLKEHQAGLSLLQFQQSARVAPAPTADEDVRKKLREYDEPVSLFGEGVSIDRQAGVKHQIYIECFNA